MGAKYFAIAPWRSLIGRHTMTTEELIRVLVADARDGRRRKLGPSGRIQGAHAMKHPVALDPDRLRTEVSSPIEASFLQVPK